ncbi:hypothetical protein ACQPUI_04000 [Clostridium butyricum]|uniref:hypothetical protein n=1 Tax=Clostridium butyricum TaxID=1492 RepID=UPI003D32A002
MKIYKKTIICMIIMCAAFLSLSLMLEFNILMNISYHKDYLENTFLGIFASGLLVLIPSIVSYYYEKKQYYLDIYNIAAKLLYSSLEIIKYFEEHCQDGQLVSNMFDVFSMRYDELISKYSQFTYFFYFSERDKLIESILNEITKYYLIHEEILKLSKQLKEKKINLETYTDCFEKVKEELVDTYKNTFINYQNFISSDIKHFIKDKVLNTYIK